MVPALCGRPPNKPPVGERISTSRRAYSARGLVGRPSENRAPCRNWDSQWPPRHHTGGGQTMKILGAGWRDTVLRTDRSVSENPLTLKTNHMTAPAYCRLAKYVVPQERPRRPSSFALHRVLPGPSSPRKFQLRSITQRGYAASSKQPPFLAAERAMAKFRYM